MSFLISLFSNNNKSELEEAQLNKPKSKREIERENRMKKSEERIKKRQEKIKEIVKQNEERVKKNEESINNYNKKENLYSDLIKDEYKTLNKDFFF